MKSPSFSFSFANHTDHTPPQRHIQWAHRDSHFFYSLISLKSVLCECFMPAASSWSRCLHTDWHSARPRSPAPRPHLSRPSPVSPAAALSPPHPPSPSLSLCSMSLSLNPFLHLDSLQLAPFLCLEPTFPHPVTRLLSGSWSANSPCRLLSLHCVYYSSPSPAPPLISGCCAPLTDTVHSSQPRARVGADRPAHYNISRSCNSHTYEDRPNNKSLGTPRLIKIFINWAVVSVNTQLFCHTVIMSPLLSYGLSAEYTDTHFTVKRIFCCRKKRVWFFFSLIEIIWVTISLDLLVLGLLFQ